MPKKSLDKFKLLVGDGVEGKGEFYWVAGKVNLMCKFLRSF